MVLLISLVVIVLLVIVLHFHGQLIVLVYFLDGLFPSPPPDTKTLMAAYQPIPTPLILLLKDGGWILPS